MSERSLPAENPEEILLAAVRELFLRRPHARYFDARKVSLLLWLQGYLSYSPSEKRVVKVLLKVLREKEDLTNDSEARREREGRGRRTREEAARCRVVAEGEKRELR